MQDLLDIHTHSLASVHAYSSIREMAEAAVRKGLKLLGISDHAPAMPDTFGEYYFCNLKVIPRRACEGYGVDLVVGAELNIRDYTGSTDLVAQFLERLDYTIVSLHEPCIRPGTREENTAALIGAMSNPKVRIIGHPDNPRFPVDFPALARAAAERHVLLEINNSSYAPGGSRQGSRELAAAYFRAIKEAGAKAVVNSDAHIEFDVGRHDSAWKLIEEHGLPEEQIVNSRPEALQKWLKEDRREPFP